MHSFSGLVENRSLSDQAEFGSLVALMEDITEVTVSEEPLRGLLKVFLGIKWPSLGAWAQIQSVYAEKCLCSDGTAHAENFVLFSIKEGYERKCDVVMYLHSQQWNRSLWLRIINLPVISRCEPKYPKFFAIELSCLLVLEEWRNDKIPVQYTPTYSFNSTWESENYSLILFTSFSHSNDALSFSLCIFQILYCIDV